MQDDVVKRAAEVLEGVTPGPWKQGKNNPDRVSCNGRYIANCDPTHANHPTVEANARFIAAARDLVPAMAADITALRDKLATVLDRAAETHGAQAAEITALRAEVAKWKDRHFKARDERDKAKIAAANYAAFNHEWRARAEAAEAERNRLREAAQEAARQLRIIAGMDMIGASAVAFNAARKLEAALTTKGDADERA